jgi:hypothetical protein
LAKDTFCAIFIGAMGTILLIINFGLLLFWIRLWADPRREFYFNPFLSGPVKFVDSVVGALGLPVRLTCILIIGFGLIFKTAVAFRYSYPWELSLGSVFFFTPTTSVFSQLLTFSVLDFLLFVVRLWTTYLLIGLITPAARHNRATEAFHFAARPFSLMAPLARFALLVAAHVLIVFELTQSATYRTLEVASVRGGLPQMPPTGLPEVVVSFLRLGWMAAASFADGLNAMRSAVMVLVISSLLAMIMRNNLLRQISHEALNVVMGRFARSSFSAGVVDLGPLVFFFALQIIYSVVSSLLLSLTTMVS